MLLCSNDLQCFREKFAAVDKQYTEVPIFDAFSESLYQGKIIERMKWTRGTPLSPMVIRFAPAIWLPNYLMPLFWETLTHFDDTVDALLLL